MYLYIYIYMCVYRNVYIHIYIYIDRYTLYMQGASRVQDLVYTCMFIENCERGSGYPVEESKERGLRNGD